MNRKIFILISLFIIASLLLVGCNMVEKREKAGKVIDGKEVVATVNGAYVLKADYDAKVKAAEDMIKSYYGEGVLKTDEGKTTLENVKKQILEQMINDELIKQNAKALNINVAESEISEQLEALKAQFGGEDNFKKTLEEQHLTLDGLKDSMWMEMLKTKLTDEIGKDIKISDDEIKAYYESHPDDFKEQPDQVKARHILVDTEKEARDLLKQLKDGADFAELAKAHSKDKASADNGGDLGYFGRGQMVQEFEDAAFALDAGDVSEPVKTDFGYHIIKVEDKKIYPVLAFDKVKDSIREMLLYDKKASAFEEKLKAWKKQADIKQYL